ncbi:Glucose transporter type 1 [Dictyocoela muelleri]|nr:Glucose transporter type 1 [Dictyocoela muelleri]
MAPRRFSIISSLIASISSFQFGINLTYLESFKDIYFKGQPINKYFFMTQFKVTKKQWTLILSLPFLSALIGHLLASFIHKNNNKKIKLDKIKLDNYQNKNKKINKKYNVINKIFNIFREKITKFLKNYFSLNCRYLNLISFSSFLYLFGTVMIFLSPSLNFILIGRFIIGIAVGISCFIIPVYISNINLVNDRGLCGSFHQFFITFGVSSGQLISLLFHKEKHFLLVYGIIFIITISHLILLRRIKKVPDRSRELNLSDKEVNKSDNTESNKCFDDINIDYDKIDNNKNDNVKIDNNNYIDDKIDNDNNNYIDDNDHYIDDNDHYEIINLDETKKNDNEKSLNDEKSLYTLLTTPKAYKSLFLSILFHIGQQMSGITTVTVRSNEIFDNYENPRLATFFIGSISILSTFFCMFFVDRVGRRKCMFWSIFISFLGLFCIYGSVGNKKKISLENIIKGYNIFDNLGFLKVKSENMTILGVAIFLLGYSLGLGPVVWLITCELFPIEFQNSAVLLSVAVNWIFAFFVPLISSLVENYSKALPYLGYMGFLGVLSVVLGFFYEETKGKEGSFQ